MNLLFFLAIMKNWLHSSLRPFRQIQLTSMRLGVFQYTLNHNVTARLLVTVQCILTKYHITQKHIRTCADVHRFHTMDYKTAHIHYQSMDLEATLLSANSNPNTHPFHPHQSASIDNLHGVCPLVYMHVECELAWCIYTIQVQTHRQYMHHGPNSHRIDNTLSILVVIALNRRFHRHGIGMPMMLLRTTVFILILNVWEVYMDGYT